jgi:prepilin-type N-terminal cleavage/methylation domain-containing protein
MYTSQRTGFSLLELLLALVLVGILATIALPPLNAYLQRVRMRGTLDRFTTDLFHARMIAVRSGERIHVRLEPGPAGCVGWYEIRYAETGEVLRRVNLAPAAAGPCLTVSGTPTISINSRGMPVGAQRTIRVKSGALGDSLRISIVGRVNRLYSAPHSLALRMRKTFPLRQ